MRLLTLNTLFKGDVEARLRALGSILASSDHDVVCLQEVMFRRGARRLASAAARSLPHSAFTGAVMLRGGLVLLSRRAIHAYHVAVFRPARPLRPELLMRKGFQLARIALPDGEVAVLNTHLSADRHLPEPQRRELRRLAEVVKGVPTTVPLVVAGDLNVPRESPLLAEFLASAGLSDLRAGDPEPTYRPTPSWPAPPALDHMLVRGFAGGSRLVFKDAVPLGDGRSAYLSDHYGIEADLVRV